MGTARKPGGTLCVVGLAGTGDTSWQSCAGTSDCRDQRSKRGGFLVAERAVGSKQWRRPTGRTVPGVAPEIDEPAASSQSPRRFSIGAAVGVLVGGLSVAFLVRSLLRDRAAVGAALGTADLSWLGLGAVFAVGGMLAMAVPWAVALRLLGAPVQGLRHVPWYFVGEIGKYVPGGLWPVLGRAEIARRAGAGAGPAYGSVVLSLIALYLAAFAVAVVLVPLWLLPGAAGAWWLVGAVALPFGLLALHPRCVTRGLRVGARVLHRDLSMPVPAWGVSLRYVASYVPAWTLIALATWAVTRALTPDAPLDVIAFAAVVSWIAGFLAVPVPGGVGVREAVFIAIAGDSAVAAAAAVLARVVFVGIDVAGALAGAAWMAGRGRSENPTTD